MRAPPGIQTLKHGLQSSGSTNLLGKSERAFLVRRSYWELDEILKVNETVQVELKKKSRQDEVNNKDESVTRWMKSTSHADRL